MIGRGFKSVGWVAGVGAAALGCYLLSLQVATERADLARVERQIIATKQQIRSLQTELGTRGRLTQLEQWNQDVLALAAPASGQFLQDEFTLARLDMQSATPADNAQVRMAALDTAEREGAATPVAPVAPATPAPAIAAPGAQPPTTRPELVHRASFTPAQSRAAIETNLPKPVKGAQVRDPAEPKPAKAKSPATTRAASIASAEAPPPARAESRRPVERSAAERGSSARTNQQTDLARAVAAATSPTRAATPRATERGSTARSGASERPTAIRAAADRPATIRSGATAGNTGRK